MADEHEGLILVADNDADIRNFVQVNLEMEGFDVAVAQDGEEALAVAANVRPALVILDVMMPKMDGFEVCRRLRSDPKTSAIPVIILTARSLTVDKVVGLTAGADDYVLKPFDPVELIARVRTTLRRARELRATSPLTGLPGNHVIERELASRLQHETPVALIYADLNDFKSFNDHYGFLRGDDVISMTADVLLTAVREAAGDDAFVGHIGGDDFLVMCDPPDVPGLCERVMADFDERIATYYDPEDWARGCIEVPDRRGHTRACPPVSIALGVASTDHGAYGDHRGIVAAATEMKSFLKEHQRSSAYAIDSRGAAGESSQPPRR